MNNVTFTPVRGSESNVLNIPYRDGYVYFTTDTKKIFLDADGKNKMPMGGNSGIYFGNKEISSEEANEDNIYFSLSDIEGENSPNIGDLILNTPDGCFYKVTTLLDNNQFIGFRLTVAGGGGGGANGYAQAMTVKISGIDDTISYIYGQQNYMTVTPMSAMDKDDNPADNYLTLRWTVRSKDDATLSTTGIIDVTHNTPIQFEFGSKLYEGYNYVEFMLEGPNSGTMRSAMIKTIVCVKMGLKMHNNFTPSMVYTGDSITMACTVEGNNVAKILEFWFDGMKIATKRITKEDNDPKKDIQITKDSGYLTHGYHPIEFHLYQELPDGSKGAEVAPLMFEIAYKDANNQTDSIIWLGEYQSQYNNYDKIVIPYLVLTPGSDTSVVHFYKDGTELSSSPTNVTFNSAHTDFQKLEIIDADAPPAENVGAVMRNNYQITCNGASRDIVFYVLQTGKMILAAANNLITNFDAAGRSNNESTVTRDVWTYVNGKKTIVGKFNNFNWYNNGWITDVNGNTCLRISNGASFEIPIGALVFNGSSQADQSKTFEFEFKIRNIQNYEHLIKLVTRYENDDSYYEAYLAVKENWDSYDQFLNYYLPTINQRYDDLTYRTVQSEVSTATAFCNYYDNNNTVGFCLGTQDAFFKTNVDTLNVNYVEDRIVNLALVFSKEKSLVSIYLNGVLSGAACITDNSSFTVTNESVIFNSDFCDIDLYKFRVYNTDFSIAQVLNNYAVDLRDTEMYTQSTTLSRYNENIAENQLDFQSMLTYNSDHPDDYLMPYIVFSNVDGDALPFSKMDGKSITFQYVNTGLDRAYATGELDTLAENYYEQSFPIAWIREIDIPTIIADASDVTTSNYYFTDANDVTHYIMKTHFPKSTKLKKTSETKSVQVVDEFNNPVYEEDGVTPVMEKVADPENSYEIPIFRQLSKVENYYLHHGASFIANEVELKVQGTSSQFYPRRNYKAKCKGKMFANSGPFTNDPMYMEYFFMDNDQVGTNKFTLKIDYMESSGSYNTGLANLVQNAYTKHPLEDYSNVIDLPDVSQHRTSVQGFPTMAFHKKANETIYIGRYNMNIDKGSDECYGYKLFSNNDPILGKKLTTSAVLDKKGKPSGVAKIAECWEFSDNNRGFCSFRDPQKRPITEIGDEPGDFFFQGDDARGQNSAGSCPNVADSFEYRYHTDGDMLDYLYNPADNGDIKNDLLADYEITEDQIDNYQWRKNFLFDKMKNWEKLCKWVWSTDSTQVDSESTMYVRYGEVHGGQYYIGPTTINTFNTSTNKLSSEDALVFSAIQGEQPTVTLTQTEVVEYLTEHGVTQEVLDTSLFGSVDEENSTESKTIYKATTDDIFRAYATLSGYTYVAYTQVLDENTDTTINEGTYLGGNIIKRSVAQNDMQQNPSEYETDKSKALSAPYEAGGNTYYFDTKEYRLAKFKKEFTEHIDKEYALVYFVITEVFMCYDSRGKNAMFASWGPQQVGGNYIWYPVFYDLDTQLGINNTGIPSFEYYVNASADGCFSTNDSVLWGNIYQCFFDDIKAKYQELRTRITKKNSTTNIAPLAGSIEYFGQSPVEHIENWYNCNPKSCNSMNMRGKRPLIAINYDEYYKYISIMNPLVGYQGTNGEPKVDNDNGSFLYALQGDRSLSRQQFLMRRINFIDSWLTQGNYKEGTGATIKFRISANDPADTSDAWVDNTTNTNSSGEVIENLHTNAGYYGITYTKVNDEYIGNDGTKLDGTTVYKFVNNEWVVDVNNVTVTTVDENTKTIPRQVKDVNGDYYKLHDLDANFFVKLSPYQRSYVTLATDNAPLPSKEYEGTPVRFEFPSNVIIGVQSSPQYAEQLLYLYGADYLKDIGDVSLLYPREFEVINASHLQRILLGNDTPNYFNKKLKSPKFDAAATASGVGGKPLLKEVVLTNVQIQSDTIVAFDFSSAEKLNIFRALGTNISAIDFANGVALHTLHLPSSITKLVLKEARNLTDGLITSYTPPTKDAAGNWQAQRGLYIKDLTDREIGDSYLTSDINRLEIIGGKLGYDSYTLLKKLVHIKEQNQTNLRLSLEDVNWTPYTKLDKGYSYNASESTRYYYDNEHYQLLPYTFTTLEKWDADIKNGMLYIKDEELANERINDITSLDLLIQIAEDANNRYFNTDESNNAIPRITGNIYINNTELIDEGYIKNTLLTQWYPNLNIFVNNVRKAYSAKFVRVEDDESLTTIGTQKISYADYQNGEQQFISPYASYASLTSKDNYDFLGWAKKDNQGNYITLGQEVYNEEQTNTKYYIYDTNTKRYVLNTEAFNENNMYYTRSYQSVTLNENTYKNDGTYYIYSAITGEYIPTTANYNSSVTYYEAVYTQIVLVDTAHENNLWENQVINYNTYEYVYYIRYRRHPYHFTFRNVDETIVTQYDVPYGDYLTDPQIMVSSPREVSLDLLQTYQFLGWSVVNNSTVPEDLTQLRAIKDLDFYAVYQISDNVRSNVLDSAYLNMGNNGALTGIKDIHLSGKIVLPNTVNGINMKYISTVSWQHTNMSLDISHIFLENPATHALEQINANAFKIDDNENSALRYFELPTSHLVSIGASAFANNKQMFKDIDQVYVNQFFASVSTIGAQAFQGATQGFTCGTLVLPNNITRIDRLAFYQCENITTIQFGTPDAPMDYFGLVIDGSNDNGNGNFTECDNKHSVNFVIYGIPGQESYWNDYIYNLSGISTNRIGQVDIL